MKLLIVDDHADTAMLLHRLLLNVGYDCRTAHSCREAMAIAEGEIFDLLVTDVGLPDGTGADLLQELRTIYGLEGIALTGWDSPDVVQSIKRAGFLSHVLKPIDHNELHLIIAQALAMRRERPKRYDECLHDCG